MEYKIAIDGSAGTGKSSVSKILAKNNDLYFLSSGSIYRACAYILRNTNFDDTEIIKDLLETNKIKYENNEILINDNKIKNELFTIENTNLASKFSKNKFLRNHVNSILRNCSKNKSIIMEGRDIGTNVFPNADLKFFLKASLIEKVKRRKKDYDKLGKKPQSFIYLTKEIFLRDLRDKFRKNDPLRKSHNSIIISTNKKELNEVVDEIQFYIDEFLKCKK